jgi:hypothetical protein
MHEDAQNELDFSGHGSPAMRKTRSKRDATIPARIDALNLEKFIQAPSNARHRSVIGYARSTPDLPGNLLEKSGEPISLRAQDFKVTIKGSVDCFQFSYARPEAVTLAGELFRTLTRFPKFIFGAVCSFALR